MVEMSSIKKLRQIITMVLFRMGLYEFRSINYARIIAGVLMRVKRTTNLKRRLVALDMGRGSGFFSQLLESMGLRS